MGRSVESEATSAPFVGTLRASLIGQNLLNPLIKVYFVDDFKKSEKSVSNLSCRPSNAEIRVLRVEKHTGSREIS